MITRQLELKLGNGPSSRRFSNRKRKRGHYWFEQMRKAVDDGLTQAVARKPDVEPKAEQPPLQSALFEN